jgi:hypothetical protein
MGTAPIGRMNDWAYSFDTNKKKPRNHPIIYKDACRKCGYFTNKGGKGRRFKCAVTGNCPGIDFTERQKANAVFR